VSKVKLNNFHVGKEWRQYFDGRDSEECLEEVSGFVVRGNAAELPVKHWLDAVAIFVGLKDACRTIFQYALGGMTGLISQQSSASRMLSPS